MGPEAPNIMNQVLLGNNNVSWKWIDGTKGGRGRGGRERGGGGGGRGGGRGGKGGGGRREEERGWKLEFSDYCLSIHLSIATIKVIFFTEQLYSFLYTTFYTTDSRKFITDILFFIQEHA